MGNRPANMHQMRPKGLACILERLQRDSPLDSGCGRGVDQRGSAPSLNAEVLHRPRDGPVDLAEPQKNSQRFCAPRGLVELGKKKFLQRLCSAQLERAKKNSAALFGFPLCAPFQSAVAA
jgi:hypothetical protein